MTLEKLLALVAQSTQHKQFYHFTDRSNLSSIKSHGLLSTAQLHKRKLFNSVKTGGDENSLASDRANGTDGYVCLCFTSNHPMAHVAREAGRIDPVYLSINPEIIWTNGAMITSAPSNQNGIPKRPVADTLKEIDLEVIYKRMEWGDPAINQRLRTAEKYEILIPNEVALKYITGGI